MGISWNHQLRLVWFLYASTRDTKMLLTCYLHNVINMLMLDVKLVDNIWCKRGCSAGPVGTTTKTAATFNAWGVRGGNCMYCSLSLSPLSFPPVALVPALSSAKSKEVHSFRPFHSTFPSAVFLRRSGSKARYDHWSDSTLFIVFSEYTIALRT